MRPLSEATSRVASKNFSRKYIALGRLVNQWTEIMGEGLADKAQPLKIHYRKAGKEKKPYALLDIATSASNATILNYQKGLILERINALFGDDWIKDIRFVVSELAQSEVVAKKIKQPLTGGEKKYLSEVLDQIEDPDIKEKLESLGKAILTDKK
tara:strand:+ start:6043 stop:6507 length:465 start_codon:yes stop_codon:yes gene_type:complete